MLLASVAPLGRVCGQEPFAVGANDDVGPTAAIDSATLDGCTVIARIEGQVVLACEVLWEVNKILETQAAGATPEQLAVFRQQLLQNEVKKMLDRKIVYAEFLRSFPMENMPKLEESLQQPFEEEEIPRLMETLGVRSREDLERELVRLGSSMADVRRSYKERQVVQFWVRSKIKINEEVSPDEMLEYYRTHLSDYEYPTQVRWEELMVRKSRFPQQPALAGAEVAKLGNEVWQRAAAIPGGLQGPAFADIAKARSDGVTAQEGGVYDWTRQGSLKATAVDEALFSLQVGQMSRILESENGYHIVRVLERKEAGRRPFTEVQGEIREKLKEARFQSAVMAFLGKIRRDARVWTPETGTTTVEILMSRPPSTTQQR